MVKYRIRFCKEGTAKFVSHLDLLRVFTRCARRIDLELEYSQGFNPHAELVFSAPLPLGMTSEAEYVDLSLTRETDTDALLETLKRSLPEGIRPLKIRKLEPGEGSVMKPVRYAKYRIFAQYAGTGRGRLFRETFLEIFEGAVRICLSSDEPILTLKKSKSGTKMVDIRSMILSFGDEPECSEEGAFSFYAVLACGNEVNLRPEVAFRGVFDNINGIDPAERAEDAPNECPGNILPARFLSAHKIEFLDGDKKVLW